MKMLSTAIIFLISTATYSCSFAIAQINYPTRPITLVVASAPGGPADTAARLLSDKMTPILGQKIIVENVPGGGGITGAARAARADPDGYTLLVHQTGITIAPALNAGLQFDVGKDLAVVGLINEGHSLLIGRSTLPANTFPELLAWMQGPGKPAKIAHPGAGTLGHLVTELFGRFAGTEINAIAYRGIGPALNDVVGGHVDLLWGSAAAFAPMVNSGAAKAFVYGGPSRSHLAPDLPAISEFQAPDVLAAPVWHAMFAPANTPKEIIMKLNGALRQALADTQIVKTFREGAIEVFPAEMQTPEAGDAYVRRELTRWRDAITNLSLK